MMYSQVYLHRVRRIYDIHLQDFLAAWLPGGRFPVKLSDFFGFTDNEITAALYDAAFDSSKPGYEHAVRIVQHEHFRVFYRRNPVDTDINIEAGLAVFNAAKVKFGENMVKHDKYISKGGAPDFPVSLNTGEEIVSSTKISEVINIPTVSVENVYIAPERLDEATKWLNEKRLDIITLKTGG